MQSYTRGLAEVGARVFGVGDTPIHGISPELRGLFADYLQVPRIMDEEDVVRRVHAWMRGRSVDRVEGLWEPLVLLAARLREHLGVPGMSVDTVRGFRDKQLMKERLAAAGVRVPRSARCRSVAAILEAVERIGFPVCIKPIDGAGSADTYRVNDAAELKAVLPALQHVPEVSCEEFVDGEEFTFDTLCIDGQIVYNNVAQYLPRPLVARSEEWISPIICTIRDLRAPKLQGGIAMGHKVIEVLGMGTGLTHMEWYRKSDGEVVFGEIGCRPGGAHLIDQMNYTSDIDLFRDWARAVCYKGFEGRSPRRYNTAIIFKRAMGEGRIRHIEGLNGWLGRCGQWVCEDTLLRPGQHRRNWRQTLVSDGFVIVRHPDWDQAMAMAQAAATDIRLYAGG